MDELKVNISEIIKCQVVQPSGFNPLTDEQNIEIMRPIFDEFDALDCKFNGYNEFVSKQLIKQRDIMTFHFYNYPALKVGDEVWDSLAHFRYQNEMLFNRYKFWRFVLKNQ